MKQKDTRLSGKDRFRGRGRDRIQLQGAWIESFRKIGLVIHTCQKIGIEYTTWSDWMKDPEFQAKFSLANQEVTEKLESAMIGRALNGVDDPIYQSGKLVGHRKQFSDDLLKMALRARDPDKYRDVIKHEFDEKLAQQMASEFIKAVRRAAPTMCPHCKTDLRIPEKLAAELKTLSAKLGVTKWSGKFNKDVKVASA